MTRALLILIAGGILATVLWQPPTEYRVRSGTIRIAYEDAAQVTLCVGQPPERTEPEVCVPADAIIEPAAPEDLSVEVVP